jgi:hypothetical protein
MKTTLVIDDELYRRVKARAALEGRKVTELVEEGLRAALERGSTSPRDSDSGSRVVLPLIRRRADEPTMMAGMSLDEIHERLCRLQLEDDLSHAASSD